MARRAAKRDANHTEIVQALRAVGVGVHDTGSAGDGMADLVTFHRGAVRLVELKDGNKPPSERRLTPAQVKLQDLARAHGCEMYVAESVDEALRIHGLIA